MAQVIPYHTTSTPIISNPSRTFFELLGVLIPPYKAIVDSVNLQDTLAKYTSNNPRLAQEEFDYAITTRQLTIPIFSENSTTVTTTAADMATLPTMPITQQDQQFSQMNKDNQKYLQQQQQQQYQQRQSKSLPAQHSLLPNQPKPNEASEQQHNNNSKQQSTQGEQDIQDAWQSVELDENDEDITAMLKIRQKVMEIKREFDGIKAAGQASSSSSILAVASRNGSIAAAPPASGDLPGVASFQSPNYLLTNEEDTNIPENYYFPQQYQDGQLYYHSRQVPAQDSAQSNRGYEQQFNYENDRLNYLNSNSNQLYNQRDERFTGITTTSEGEYQQADLQYQQIDDRLDEYHQQHNQLELPSAYNNSNGQMIRIEAQTPINYNDNDDGQLSAQQYELQQQLQQQLQQLSMIREEEEQESTLEMHYFSGSGKYNPSRGSQMSSVQSNNTNSNNDNNNSNNTNNNGNYNGSTYGDNRVIAIPADGTIDLPSEGSFEGQQQQQQQQPFNRKNHDILAKIAELDKKVKTALLKSEHK